METTTVDNLPSGLVADLTLLVERLWPEAYDVSMLSLEEGRPSETFQSRSLRLPPEEIAPAPASALPPPSLHTLRAEAIYRQQREGRYLPNGRRFQECVRREVTALFEHPGRVENAAYRILRACGLESVGGGAMAAPASRQAGQDRCGDLAYVTWGPYDRRQFALYLKPPGQAHVSGGETTRAELRRRYFQAILNGQYSW